MRRLHLCAGKTVEVNNTDAEGRLTLADALWYAQVCKELYGLWMLWMLS
jgi:leucyl aminopeptidase